MTSFIKYAGLNAVGIWILLLIHIPLHGQAIFIDKPVRAGELTVFPDIRNEHQYYYLVDKARLATGDDGKEQFSFLRYVQNSTSQGSDISQEGEGGGIVHAVVELGVTDEQLDEARRELNRIDPDGEIMGPVIYSSGKFGLVSSFAEEGSDFTEHLLGLGNAPILDGNKAAISLSLTKKGAKLLWESFKTATPDVTFSFEMELEGYRSPIEATLEADFDQIYKHKAFDVGLATPVLQAEATAAFDELTRNGTIKFSGVQADENMERLIEIAYKKIADMMMEPLNTSTNQLSELMQGQSALDRASSMLTQARNDTKERNQQIRADNDQAREDAKEEAEANAARSPDGVGTAYYTKKEEETLPTFSLAASFKMKEIKTTGKFKVSLNKIMADDLSIRFDENIGNLSKLAKDNTHFRQINLDDPFFRQREIAAFIDGYNAEDFGKYINFVTLRMKKTHAEGAVTDQEIRVDRNSFNEKGNYYKMVYGWKDDNNRKKWMEYQYEILWSFFGGHEVVQDFRTTTFSAINLKPPYERRTITLEGDPDYLKDQEVRSVTVKLFYHIGGAEKVKNLTLSVYKGELSEQIEILLPENEYDYEYELQWRLRGNKVVSSGRQKSSESILFVDEVPEG